MNFLDKLKTASKNNNTLVCVGLDAEKSKLPNVLKSEKNPQLSFNREIIDATKDFVCAYKPNTAFYEAEGVRGIEALVQTISYVPDHIPVILDAKRGDIGNTAAQYARFVFDVCGADAVTLHCYLGRDSVSPFLDYSDRGLFLLVKTSNASAVEIQDLVLRDGRRLFEAVGSELQSWRSPTKAVIGAVVGATYPQDLRTVCQLLPAAPILVPGVGAQGGKIAEVLEAGGSSPLIINSSRGIIFASNGGDFAAKASQAAGELRAQINQSRN